MTWAANGAFPGQTEFTAGGTFPLNNTAIGDLVAVVALSIDSNANYVTGITGGGCTWSQIGTHFVGTVNGSVATAWEGTVTATGSQTATVVVTGGGPTIAVVSQEFSSTVGSWTVDQVVHLDSAGTNTWPTQTPAGTGELAFGFAADFGIASAGSTSGWTYKVTSHQDGVAWNTGVSAPSAPVWADSGQAFGAMVLFKEAGAASPSGLLMASII